MSSIPAVLEVQRLLPSLLLVAFSLTTISCHNESSGPNGQSVGTAEVSSSSTGKKNHSLADQDQEVWQAYYMQGKKVGHGYTKTEEINQGSQRLIRTSAEAMLEVRRFGQPASMRTEFTTLEKPTGELIRFETKVQMGRVPMSAKGRVRGEKLDIELSTQGKSQSQSLPWSLEIGGFFAVEQSLHHEPIKPGQQRNFRAIVAITNQVGNVELQAKGLEEVQLLDGSRELLRVEKTIRLPNNSLDLETMWVDEQGNILKTKSSTMGLESFRTTRQVALSQSKGVDVGQLTLVPVDRPLADPHESAHIRYRAHLLNDDPVKAFPQALGQKVTRVDQHTAILDITPVTPNTPLAGVVVPPPETSDLEPNNLIQSDDARVTMYAKGIAPGKTAPWEVALEIETFVHQNIREKNFSQAFATAAEVAQHMEGDCTEHAVLLAAIARAKKIPARVVMGLVYIPSKQSFGYHMWDEVYVNSRWVPLDGTLGKGGIGGGHIKIATSSLAGSTPYGSLLPVARVLGQLQLQITQVE